MTRLHTVPRKDIENIPDVKDLKNRLKSYSDLIKKMEECIKEARSVLHDVSKEDRKLEKKYNNLNNIKSMYKSLNTEGGNKCVVFPVDLFNCYDYENEINFYDSDDEVQPVGPELVGLYCRIDIDASSVVEGYKGRDTYVKDGDIDMNEFQEDNLVELAKDAGLGDFSEDDIIYYPSKKKCIQNIKDYVCEIAEPEFSHDYPSEASSRTEIGITLVTKMKSQEHKATVDKITTINLSK